MGGLIYSAFQVAKCANTYASKYELYLPDKKVLQKKLKQWLEEEGADID